ncbi:FAD-dependent monooxygenase [Variovorax sp. J22R187]|nr:MULTISPECIES: FAD-dependent monooxygenase [unclassified Variovorax]MDM0022362.1 FAD-dependent monooxygenase [Variovorax sp. J22R187]MDM0029018.1 FAD-dependent monooxygenase [Variovorax sp. J31P216]
MAPRPNVLVIGGGIGGLFAANALIGQGLRVSVYEQASALGEIGAGVFVTPNAVRHLERVGLGPAVERWGARVGSGSYYFRHDGTPIAPVQVSDASGWNATFGMHRADLVGFLAANLPAGIVHTGHRAVGFAQTEDVARVEFANGAIAEADVVVAADGIHSELRSHVFPPSKPVFHGTISYRGLVSRERLPNWPMDRWQMWAGPSRHFLVFPVRHGTMVNYVGFVPTDQEMKESWSAPGDPAVLRREFEGWDPRIADVLQQVDETFRWALYDREPLPTWTKGRLTLLGDAAHPMLPHLGQGANQCIEDGMALATILGHVDTTRVPASLLAYERLRRKRVAEIQLGARQNGLRLDSTDIDLSARDAQLAAHAEFRKHLYAYDVVPHARAAATALLE